MSQPPPEEGTSIRVGRAQRDRRPTEKQSQLNDEQAQRRTKNAEQRRRRELGNVPSNPRLARKEHQYTSRFISPTGSSAPFQSFSQHYPRNPIPDTLTPPPPPRPRLIVPFRTQSIERPEYSAPTPTHDSDCENVDEGIHYASEEPHDIPNRDEPFDTGTSNTTEIIGDKRVRPSSSHNNVDRPHKTIKLSASSGRRICARDFDGNTHQMINEACTRYRCMISTKYAFPEPHLDLDYARNAWTEACTHLGVQVDPTCEIIRLIQTRASQLRGEVKARIRPLIPSYYEFHEGQSNRSQMFNMQRAAILREDLNFAYKQLKFNTDGTLASRKGLYQNAIIQKAVNLIWFINQGDEGVMYHNLFNPLPIPALALVLTAIECSIEEWETGTRRDVKFTALAYNKIYNEHHDMLIEFENETREYQILPKIQEALHKNGRCHAGVPPVSHSTRPKLTAEAIADAIREWDGSSGSEFSNDEQDINYSDANE